MTVFEYGSGLISIVVGLGVARVLGGIGLFLSARNRSTADWIVFTWSVGLLLNLVIWWMAMWSMLRSQPEISQGILITVTTATALLYLATFLLLPGKSADAFPDADTSTEPPRGAFFICLAAHYAMGLTYTVFYVTYGGVAALSPIAAMVVIAGAGIKVETNRGYIVHLIVWATGLIIIGSVTQAIN